MKLSRGSALLIYVVLALLAIFSLGPLVLMLNNSFKNRIEITMNPLALPSPIRWQNYVEAWQSASLGSALLNTLFISTVTVLLTSCVAGMAAFVLSRKAVKGWSVVSLYFLICTTIPVQLFLIPLFFIFQKLGFVNNRLALCLVYTALYTPFSVFLLRTYFLRVSPEILDSARVDGANDWQIFSRIMLPLIQPGLLTIALVVGLWSWNEFLLAVTFLQDEALFTATVRFYSFSGRYVTEWGKMMSAATMIMTPIIVLFTFLQQRFIEGMTAGGVKG
ncbi:MAG: carbohydrate ABC transporter permease [Firmicutes bacterium]|nr:carbohydrate ABC transporter permease [Bacillota bacterium]